MRRFQLLCTFALVAVWASSASSCLEVAGKPAKDPYALRDVVTTDGMSLEQACTPSGVEVCFDAVDNNCNGIIDEGCGLHTGVLQFAIAWDAPEADIDLDVTDPSGELAQPGEPTLGGLFKDRDCPKDGGDCYGQNIENVYLVGGEPERGRYRVVVRLDKLGGATAPLRVRLGVRVGQRSYSMSFDLSPGDDANEKAFEFTL
jgi:tRNA (guanosine-2'-O-)-methyltransferase